MAVTARVALAFVVLGCAPRADLPGPQAPPSMVDLPADATVPNTGGREDAATSDTAAVITPPLADTRGIDSALVSGYQLLVRRKEADGQVGPPEPFDLRGISWSPAERGGGFPDAGAYLRAADRDAPLMRAAGINVVKTYAPVDRAVLDKLLAHGIVAIVTVLARASDDFASAVEELRDHPGVLMWLVGNEWNFNRLYQTCALDACYARVNEVARQVKAIDPKHPVATSFAPMGELPTESDLRRLDAVEIWGLNIYSQPGFFNRFTDWRLLGQRTGLKKPIFLSEYGADAYDNRMARQDETAQAAALRRQTQEIRNQLSARNAELPCLGGTPFEWNDEWWKRGDPATHDTTGFANRGVAADSFANEEWWGVVDVDRRPRAAYRVLEELYAR